MSAVPAIIPRERLQTFIQEVFNNFRDILAHHRKLLDKLFEIQREEYPYIRSISAPLLDAALTWQDAYLEYGPHYPIAAFRIQEELGNNQAFKAFHDVRNSSIERLRY